jgi:hypothetical protein
MDNLHLSIKIEKDSEICRYSFDADPRYLRIQEQGKIYKIINDIDELLNITDLKRKIIEEYDNKADILKSKALIIRKKYRQENPLKVEVKKIAIVVVKADIQYLETHIEPGSYWEISKFEKYLRTNQLCRDYLNVGNLLLFKFYGTKYPEIIGYVSEFEYLPVIEFSKIKNPFLLTKEDFPASLTKRYLLSEIVAIYDLHFNH